MGRAPGSIYGRFYERREGRKEAVALVDAYANQPPFFMLSVRKGRLFCQQLYEGLLYNVVGVRRRFGVTDGDSVYGIHMRLYDTPIVFSVQTYLSFVRFVSFERPFTL